MRLITVFTHEVTEWLKRKALEQGVAYSKHLGRVAIVFKKGFRINLHFELITVTFSESKDKAFNNYGNLYLKIVVCVCVCSTQVGEPKSIYTGKKNTHQLPVCLFTREQGVTQ